MVGGQGLLRRMFSKSSVQPGENDATKRKDFDQHKDVTLPRWLNLKPREVKVGSYDRDSGHPAEFGWFTRAQDDVYFLQIGDRTTSPGEALMHIFTVENMWHEASKITAEDERKVIIKRTTVTFAYQSRFELSEGDTMFLSHGVSITVKKINDDGSAKIVVDKKS